MLSGIFKLDIKNVLRSVILSVVVAVMTLLLQLLQAGTAIDLKQVGIAALIAGLSSLIKLFATDDSGKVMGKV